MAMSVDILPENLEWINELVKAENNAENPSVLDSINKMDPRQIIEESTIEYLQLLRERFTAYGRVFNGYSQENQKFSETKIYGISNTAADFMVFRNNVKLVFSNSSHGIINIAFTQHAPGDFSPDGKSALKQSHDLIAQVGPFLDVAWTFQGEKIDMEQLVKYYFVEFIRISRQPRGQSKNQLLLKQIKALLHDKGIDF